MNRDDLLKVRAQMVETLRAIDQLLQPSPIDLSDVEEECQDDTLAYRDDRNPMGQLSPLGVRVMYRMFERDFEADLIAKRMKVSLISVRERRRVWRKEVTGPASLSWPSKIG